MKKYLLIYLLFTIGLRIYSQSNYSLHSDFPGGNISIEKISGDTIFMKPDLRDTESEWFYWYFAINNGKNRTLIFKFTRKNVFTDVGPAISMDKGVTWEWMGDKAVSANSFSYTFNGNDEVRFSMALPYTQVHFDNFFSTIEKDLLVKKESLCISKKGRAVEKILIGETYKKVVNKVVITARHHACEMTANYIMEGMMDAIVKDPSLHWLRENVLLMFIPFVDKDGVEDGDQGKLRRPRDHNRDYIDSSIYNETDALRKLLPDWIKGSSAVAIDLHCPWIRGNHNEDIYIVGSKDLENTNEQVRFLEIINRQLKVENKSFPVVYLPYGKDWNVATSFTKGRSFGSYTIEELNTLLSCTFEFPYAVYSGIQVAPNDYRKLGKTIAISLQEYLKKK